MNAIDQVLLKQPQTEYVFTTAGGSLFGSTVSSNASRSSGTVTLKAGSDGVDFAQQVTRELKKLNLAGVRARVSAGSIRGLSLNNSPLRGAEVDVVLQGEDAEVLRQAGRQVLAALDEQVTLSAFRPDADDRQPETITTVLGLFPLALGLGEGSEFLQPLGIVVFSGLSLATLLTLFIIPCFYVLLHGLFSPDRAIGQSVKTWMSKRMS